MNNHGSVIIGCGDIGVELGRRLTLRGQQVFGVRRSPENLPDFIQGIAADYTDAGRLETALADLAFAYVIVTITPAAFKEAAYRRSFNEGTRNILAALMMRPPRRLLFVSSTSVYHQSAGEWVDESSATEPRQFSGRQILAAERKVLHSALPATVIRFGGIYGPGRLRLISKLRAGEPITASRNFSNRIHRDDCAAMLEHLLLLDARGADVADCYVGVDCEPARLHDVQRFLAKRMGLEPEVAADSATQRGGNKRCSNKRILASGFEFAYPDYRSGYAALLQAEGWLVSG